MVREEQLEGNELIAMLNTQRCAYMLRTCIRTCISESIVLEFI